MTNARHCYCFLKPFKIGYMFSKASLISSLTLAPEIQEKIILTFYHTSLKEKKLVEKSAGQGQKKGLFQALSPILTTYLQGMFFFSHFLPFEPYMYLF